MQGSNLDSELIIVRAKLWLQRRIRGRNRGKLCRVGRLGSGYETSSRPSGSGSQGQGQAGESPGGQAQREKVKRDKTAWDFETGTNDSLRIDQEMKLRGLLGSSILILGVLRILQVNEGLLVVGSQGLSHVIYVRLAVARGRRLETTSTGTWNISNNDSSQ
jgi:hypothetical protein